MCFVNHKEFLHMYCILCKVADINTQSKEYGMSDI